MSQSTSTLPAVKFFVSAAMLATAIKRALPCIDKSSTRYSMYCLWFAVTEGKLNVQATDGRRLVSQDIPATGTIPGSFLLDYKDAKSLAALARKAGRKGEVGMELNGDKVSACNQTERAEWYDVAGRFPRTGDVLAHHYETTTGLNIGDFAELVSEAVVHTTDENRGLTLTLCPSIGPGSSPLMIVQVTRGNETLYRRCLSCPVNGPGGYAILDAEWLATMVKTLDGKAHLHLALNSHKSQVRFMQDGFTYIIMPIAEDAQSVKASKPKRTRKPRAKVAAMASAPVAVEEVAPLKPVAETTPIETHIGDDRHDSYRTFCNLGMPELATIGGRFVPFMVADSLIAGTTGFPYPPTCPSCREQYLARLEAMFPEPSPDATDPDIILDPDATVLDIPVSDDDQVIPHGWDAIEADDPKPIPRGWDAIEADDDTPARDREPMQHFLISEPKPGDDRPRNAFGILIGFGEAKRAYYENLETPAPGFSEPVPDKAPSVPQGRSSADYLPSSRITLPGLQPSYRALLVASFARDLAEFWVPIIVRTASDPILCPDGDDRRVWRTARESWDQMSDQDHALFIEWCDSIDYRPGGFPIGDDHEDSFLCFVQDCLTGIEITPNPSPEPNGDDDGSREDRLAPADEGCLPSRHGQGQGAHATASLARTSLATEQPVQYRDRVTPSRRMEQGVCGSVPAGGRVPGNGGEGSNQSDPMARRLTPAHHHHPRYLVSRFNGGFSLVPNPLAGLSHDDSTSFDCTGSVRDLECNPGADSQESRDLDRVAGALADPGVAGHPLPHARDGAGTAEAPGLDGQDGQAEALGTLTILVHGLGQPCHSADTAFTPSPGFPNQGDPGFSGPDVLMIDGRPYGLTRLADGWMIEKDHRTAYEVTMGPSGPLCSCPDAVFRRNGLDSLGCRHARALRAEGLLPSPTPTYDLLEF